MKSPIKWAGGKSWLTNYLKPTFPINVRLVEPFAGSLALSLGLEPKAALLNDINQPLITFFGQIKDGSSFSTYNNTPETFYYIREQFNILKTKVSLTNLEKQELANCFYYLNRTCFNGLYRENSKGGFNVPYGKYKTPKLETDFFQYHFLFSNWEFTCKDFESIDLQEDDYVYCDPPYDSEFTKYHKLDFKWEDQLRLVEWVKLHKGPIVISNQLTDRIKQLYTTNGFYIKEIDVARRISANGDRTKQAEILAYKNINLF